MKNHCLYVVQYSGVPVYYKNFSDQFQSSEYPLVSSFFGAIIQFSQQVIKEKLNVIELGNYRIIFQYQSDLIFIIITENTSSVLIINERLDQIVLTLYNTVNVDECIKSSTLIESPMLDEKLERIMNLEDNYSEKNIDVVKKLFEKEIFSGEIEAGALLSMKGEIYYSSLPIGDLHTALREIEIRTKVDTREVVSSPKFIWQTQKKTTFSQTVRIPNFADYVYIILLFDANVNLGMADWNLEDICKKLENAK